MKLLATLLASSAVVKADFWDGAEEQNHSTWYSETNIGTFSSQTDPEMLQMAQEEIDEESGFGGIQMRGKRKKPKGFLIDQAWSDYDLKAELLLQQIYPGVENDPDFQMNKAEIQKEDAKICSAGVDPVKGKPVSCTTDERMGLSAPMTPFQTAPRKFRQLKLMVIFLQKEPGFGKFCYYGCYCLPEGAHDLSGGGYGEPVDRIDRTCKQFNQCYSCAKLGNGQLEGTSEECIGEYTKYRFKMIEDEETGEKSIMCRNKPGTCARHICECDKRMAEDLSRYEDDWDVTYHTGRNNGEWTFADNCKKKGLGRYTKPETCCGDEFPNMRPKQGGKECCGSQPWDPIAQNDRQCCPDGRVRPAGYC